ncbi:hypothetical protein [Glycomyces salinus]|uniref:hypothetical protein n=1 Tax=Glycomyces salinus TaxID=980294 RepID=UPI0018EAB882|nr:hypothetical protein [Glycomyces salinus]
MSGARQNSRTVRLTVLAGLATLTTGLTGCGGDEENCAELYTDTIEAVEGVESVEVDCSLQLSGVWQRVDVYTTTNDENEAAEIGYDVLQAIAEEPGFDPQWSTPRSYFLEDGTKVTIGLRDLGFNGIPDVDEVREHFGVETE